MIRKSVAFIILIYSALGCCSVRATTHDKPSLLIADTGGQSSHNYRNLMSMARSAGFRVEYKNLYDLLQLSDINDYDALFFMISPRMLCMSSMRHLFNQFVLVW